MKIEDVRDKLGEDYEVTNISINRNRCEIDTLHKYCNIKYKIRCRANSGYIRKCPNCCGYYENSFAHHIEIELGESLEKYWDFEKNTVNPYHIKKHYTVNKVWIKCQEKGYHGSYEISCSKFISNRRCPYCQNKKVHPRDSFAQYHIDNTDPNFLEKYWDYEKNTVNPFEIPPSTIKEVYVRCQKKDYHGAYKTACSDFTFGKRCKLCNPKSKMLKPHIYDSFGYIHFDKIMSWATNTISPFEMCCNSDSHIDFICFECGEIFTKQINKIHNRNEWCPKCTASKGERRVIDWTNKNGISYIYNQPYFNDLLSNKGNPLRPDFILPDHKIWIEYDGEFHYEDFYKDGSYEKQVYHDKLKDEYAKKHGWKLIRIPYWEFDNIENILEREVLKDVNLC